MMWNDYRDSASFKASDVMALFILSFFGSAIFFGGIAFLVDFCERMLTRLR